MIEALELDAEGPLFGFGHSMGAAALLMAEPRRPGLFAGLVCYEPVIYPPGSATPTMAQADDKATLVAFYNSTGGDNWTTRTNWKDDTKDISEWFGVSTDINGRVVSLLDNATGTSKAYESEGGQPFRAISDLTAFSCLQAGGEIRSAATGGKLPPPAAPPTTAEISVLPSVVLAGEQVTFRVESDGRPNRYTWVVNGAASETNAPLLHWTFSEPGPVDIEVDVAAAADDGGYLAQPVMVRSRGPFVAMRDVRAFACSQ